MPDPSTSSGSPRAQSRGDWHDEIRRRLDGLRLDPEREVEVVEELSQHLDDRYRELWLRGVEDNRAISEALSELDDSDLVRELAGVERQKRSEPLALGGEAGDTPQPGALSGLLNDVRF